MEKPKIVVKRQYFKSLNKKVIWYQFLLIVNTHRALIQKRCPEILLNQLRIAIDSIKSRRTLGNIAGDF